MVYPESPEESAEFARQAVGFMEDKGIPPNPNNFAIWFHYFSGRHPDLKKELDALLSAGEPFTEEQNNKIHEAFFSFDKEGALLNDAVQKIEGELGNILKYLGFAGEGAASYGEALQSFAGSIAGTSSEDEIRTAVSGVVEATRAMEQQNRALEEKLQASSSEVVQLREDLEVMRLEAMTDGLTGIANRKLFDIELRRAAMEAMENGEDMSLLMIDIDHFKKFNDTHGHQVGDLVLKLLAMTLKANIKGADTAARYGGEEFAVVLPATSLENAVLLAEALRTRVGRKKVVDKRAKKDLGRITISIGVGGYKRGEPLSQLVARADAALYQAKGNGRDCVVSEDEVAEVAFGG